MVEKLKAALTYVSDTFVNASHFAEQVRMLQEQVDSMRGELDQLHQNNATLQDTISHIRQERDNAQAEAQQLRNEAANREHEFQLIADERQRLATQVQELQDKLTEARKSHDDAEYRAMHWEEQHTNVKKQLDGIKAALGVASTPEAPPHPVQAVGSGW